MAAQGGNKKGSSPSSQSYWKRAQSSKFSETHREKRIARHLRKHPKAKHPDKLGETRHGKNSAPSRTDLRSRISFSGQVPNLSPQLFPIFQMISNGVILDSCSRESEALAARPAPGLAWTLVKRYPTGRSELISSQTAK
jgi:hypothetical protein